MTLEDMEREQRIDILCREACTAKTTPEMRSAWRAMVSEIKRRSPPRVREMEKQKGLAQ